MSRGCKGDAKAAAAPMLSGSLSRARLTKHIPSRTTESYYAYAYAHLVLGEVLALPPVLATQRVLAREHLDDQDAHLRR